MKFIYRPSHRSSSGFTLAEIMIVVAIIGILVGIAVPAFLSSRVQSQAKSCQENQAKLTGAVQEWALANNNSVVPVFADIIGPGKYLTRTPICPATGTVIPLPPSVQANTGCPTNEPGHRILPQ